MNTHQGIDAGKGVGSLFPCWPAEVYPYPNASPGRQGNRVPAPSGTPLPLLPLILDRVPRGLRQALAQEGIPFRDLRPGPPEGRFLLSDCRRVTPRPPAPGQVLIDVGRFRRGRWSDPFDDLLDMRSQWMEWPIGGLRLTDCVSRIDKAEVRRGLLGQLRETIEQAGGIWLRLAPFPFPYRSAFNFRIDHDEFDARDFQATLKAIEGHERATTHFVSGASHQRAPQALSEKQGARPVPLKALAALRGLDVGSHGYWHHTYVSAEENVRNILRGIEVLQAAGIEPSGFAAPHGRFNAGLLEALTALRITHSSEFGLAYDDLPFLVGTGPLLQIPVHPVCLGLVLEAAARKNNAHAPPHWNPAQIILEHWEQLARKCCATGMPLFLYGHPTGRLGRYPQVLRHAIRIASESPAFWKTTFTELDRWWRARAGVTLTVHREQDCCVIAAGSLPPHHRLAVEYWRGDRVAVMPLDGPVYRFSPASLAFEVRRSAPAVRPVRIDQPGGLRGRIRRWVDWERVTPTEEIPANSLPNVTKRVLRRLLCYPKRGQDPSVHVASPYPAKDTQGS